MAISKEDLAKMVGAKRAKELLGEETAADWMQQHHPIEQPKTQPKTRKVNKMSEALLHGYEGDYKLFVGIDPGYRINEPNTGLAAMTGPDQIKEIGNYFAWQAINKLQQYLGWFSPSQIAVIVEDPKSWKGFKGTSTAKANSRKASKGGLQAVFNQFYSFCATEKVDCYPISVQGLKLYDEQMFRQVFNWQGKPLPPKDAMAAATFVLRQKF